MVSFDMEVDVENGRRYTLLYYDCFKRKGRQREKERMYSNKLLNIEHVQLTF